MVQVAHNMDVNIVCNDFIQKGRHSPYFTLVSEEPDWLEENCVSVLKEACLIELIRISKMQNDLFSILLPFVEYADPTAISDRVFCELMDLPESFQDGVIISLAHKKLSISQLDTLCSKNITFECYYTLAIEQFQQSTYSDNDLRKTLLRFQCSKFGAQLPCLLTELSSLPPSSPQKRLTVEELMKHC